MDPAARSSPERTSWPAGTLLDRLDAVTVNRLLAIGMKRRVRPAQVIIHQGCWESHVIILRAGVVKVTVDTVDGREALLAIRVAGDLVGEASALNAVPRAATVTACRECEITVISAKDLRAFIGNHPDVAVEIAGMVADRLNWANQRRVDFLAYPVEVRVARILVDLCTRHGKPDTDGLDIGVSLSQPELSSLTGASEVTVQRALRRLRRRGTISTGYRRIVVHDTSALLAVADPRSPSRP